jgi:hypothetical protein
MLPASPNRFVAGQGLCNVISCAPLTHSAQSFATKIGRALGIGSNEPAPTNTNNTAGNSSNSASSSSSSSSSGGSVADKLAAYIEEMPSKQVCVSITISFMFACV